MNKRNGLLYYYVIKRITYLEKKDNKEYLKYVKIINRYQHKFNKSIFQK